LWEMTTAFGAFMAEGHRLDPFIVLSVSTTSGEELYRRPPYEGPVVLEPDVVERMNSMMGAVVLRGTGTAARLPDRDTAGKTGTSSDWRDAWFIGYSADYVAGVWVGHDDDRSMGRTTGGSLPAQIWNDTMRVAHRGVEPHPLPGYQQPARSPREVEMATFFDSLASAFGDSDAESLIDIFR
ncbi:MAG TPA: penicillin-binding transpeptidase domain-containing protein, partial [Terricaulis sp.]|nr:penicillin-binding transpeptidase domain-containing protein [Terricaulis sp.]